MRGDEKMKRKDVLKDCGDFRTITAMTVVAHAMVRAKRGKRPSMGYCGIMNPQVAYKKAVDLICNAREMFHISDLVALYSGKNLSLSGMGGFYDTIHFLEGDRPSTIKLLEAIDQVRKHLEAELPFLKEILIPEIRTAQELRDWIKCLEKNFGAYHELSRKQNAIEA